MKHKNGFNPLSRNASHLRAMHRNMVTSLFKYERVTTTQPKALEVRRTAEKLITRAKVDTVHNRRQVARFISDDAILAKLFTEIGPRMKERAGGYTRVLKLGFRQGDAAEVAILELVDYKLETEEKAEKKDKKVADKPVTDKKPAADKKAAPAKKPAAKKEAGEKKPAAKKAKPAASAEE
jgi:large subunit ribosomal protein L17